MRGESLSLKEQMKKDALAAYERLWAGLAAEKNEEEQNKIRAQMKTMKQELGQFLTEAEIEGLSADLNEKYFQ